MNPKKTFERIRLVLVNILKQVLGQLLNLVLSVFIFKYYSKELWGSFAAYFVYINFISIIISWGNKEFLIREFSKAPNKIMEYFYRVFNSRLPLLALAIVVSVFIFPLHYFWFFTLWITSVYISQSLEVFWIYKRDYTKSILIEVISFSLLLLSLFYNKINIAGLIEYYAYYQLARTILYILIYFHELKKMHFYLDKKYLVMAASFFLLGLIGFLQSRMDFLMVTFFESDRNVAVYQIITTFFILIHALGTFLIFPYMKNIYRLQQSSVNIFQRLISFVAPLVVCSCLAVLFLITHYIYNFSLDYQYYILGFLITFPPYLYTVKIVILYKENKQDFVLRTGLIGIVVNCVVSVALLYLGYGLKGALIGSAIAHLFTAYQYLTHFSNKNQFKMNPKHDDIKQNINYYDNIAAEYDAMLTKGGRTKFIRQIMEDKLTAFVPEGTVLDFGGGTGEDLKWLLKHPYSIIFCEPSFGMRSIAIEKADADFPDANITFLEMKQADFTTWDKEPPFNYKADAVIANFAVLNCISDIELFFKNLDKVTAPKAQVFLLVLDFDFKSKILNNPVMALKSLLMKEKMRIRVEFDNHRQLVYHYSVKSIKKAAAGYFDLRSSEPLKTEGFSLIHLIKK